MRDFHTAYKLIGQAVAFRTAHAVIRSIMCDRRNNFRLAAIPQDLWRRDRPDVWSSRFVEHPRYPRLPRGLRISQGCESLRER